MRRQIRRSVFETNSSSTHSICITKDDVYNKPNSVNFTFGEFGWERDEHCDINTKASYLFTGIYGYFEQEEAEFLKNNIKEYLESEGVACNFIGEIKYEKEYFSADIDGYIDHGDDLRDFVKDVCNNKNKLFRFLFSDESFIITGNDNDDYDVNINVDYDHEEYYKGN